MLIYEDIFNFLINNKLKKYILIIICLLITFYSKSNYYKYLYNSYKN